MIFIFEVHTKPGYSAEEYASAWVRASEIIQTAAGAQGTAGPTGPGHSMIEDDGASGWGIDPAATVQELMAFPEVAKGVTIGSLIVHGEDTAVTFTAYSVAISTGTPTSLGSGTVGTLLDITDYTNSDSTTYLVLRVDVASTTADTIYGAILYTDSTGTTSSSRPLSPGDFHVNDD